MSPMTTFLTALAALNANKLRSGLTLLGIIIGVTAVIALTAIGNGAQETITARIQSLGTNLLFVRPGASTNPFGFAGAAGSAASLTLEDSEALMDPVLASHVVDVAPETSTRQQVVFERENTNTTVLGVTPSYLPVRAYELADGRSITEEDIARRAQVAVLASETAEELFGLRHPVGHTIKIGGRPFEVVGLLEAKGGTGFGNQDDRILVPVSTAYYRLGAQRTAGGEITVQNISVQIASEDVSEAATDQISGILRLRHRITDEDDFTVTSQVETIETLEETTQTFVIFLGAIASIALLVGGIGIMNIMLVSVTERTREIGIRKAMGAKRRDILSQFLVEAVLLSLTGGIIGVGLGYGFTQFFDDVELGGQALNMVFSGDIALLATAVSGAIGLFFGIYPAMQAARLHPIEALRHE